MRHCLRDYAHACKCEWSTQPQRRGTSLQEGSSPNFQGSYSPFEKTMLDAKDQSMPAKEMTDQFVSPVIPNSFLQSACILPSSYSPVPQCQKSVQLVWHLWPLKDFLFHFDCTRCREPVHAPQRHDRPVCISTCPSLFPATRLYLGLAEIACTPSHTLQRSVMVLTVRQ